MTLRSASLVLATLAALSSALPAGAQTTKTLQPGDYIAAVVNTDVVAASEVVRRIAALRQMASQQGQAAAEESLLRKQALEALIEDRVIVTFAREAVNKIPEDELNRVVDNVAVQNKISTQQLLERLKAEGMDYRTFREGLRDQMLTERARDNEVPRRIKVSDADIDAWLEAKRESLAKSGGINLAQVLISVPEGASEAIVAERRARAEQALARLASGEDFAAVAKAMSEDANKAQGGEIGLRQANRLPDVFVEAVKGLKRGEYTHSLLRTGAGFHILKVIERQGADSLTRSVQTHARHILLRISPQLTTETAARRLVEYKRQVEAGEVQFEKLARDFSEDGSAPEGGDLGWVGAGGFVPEFEEAMNALPINGLSSPVQTRFGLHLIQVLERRTVDIELKQLRDQARSALREQKFDEAYKDWVAELRAKAFVEIREWLD